MMCRDAEYARVGTPCTGEGRGGGASELDGDVVGGAVECAPTTVSAELIKSSFRFAVVLPPDVT